VAESVGEYIKKRRQELYRDDKSFSQRQVALRIGIEPSYLSKIERGYPVSLSEQKLMALAAELGEDPDLVLAMAGKVSSDVQEVIRQRPRLFASLVRDLKNLPDRAVLADKEYRLIESRLNEAQTVARIGSYDRRSSGNVYWSEEMYRLFGYEPNSVEPGVELIEKHIHPDDLPRYRAANQTAFEGAPGYDIEYRIVRDDGSTIFVQSRASFEYDDQGRMVRKIGTLQDVTDLKVARDDLEARIEERTRELRETNEQLRREIAERKRIEAEVVESRRRVLESSIRKTRFLDSMGHQVRSALNDLLGTLQLVQTTELEPDQVEYVNTALGSSRRLLAKIDTLLDYSRIESGNLESMNRQFSLRGLVDQVIQAFTGLARQKGVVLNCELADDVPDQAVADGARLRQVLSALVEFGLLSTDWGEVRIDGRGVAGGGNGLIDRVRFSVSDSGPGLDESELRSLLDGRELGAAEKSVWDAAPLELGLVSSLVDSMGGGIEISSQPGDGSTITVTIPMEQEQTFVNHGPADEKGETATPGRVLIVEDDLINQVTVKKMVESLGHTAVCAPDGKQALELLKRERFDCIFMDIQMPGMDGMETTRRIRSAPDGLLDRQLPIIAITAQVLTGDRERFLNAGMDFYIPKPVELPEIKQVLEQALGRVEEA
jgi:PAS domain S-box-containing protein